MFQRSDRREVFNNNMIDLGELYVKLDNVMSYKYVLSCHEYKMSNK